MPHRSSNVNPFLPPLVAVCLVLLIQSTSGQIHGSREGRSIVSLPPALKTFARAPRPSSLRRGPSFITDVHQDTLFSEVPTSLVSVGHGTAAWGDYDNDGMLDILLTGICCRDSLNDTSTTYYSKIYHNDSSTFTDIGASLVGVNNNDGNIWCDYNRDGYLDLFLGGGTQGLNMNPVSKIYRNDAGTFVDINANLPGLIGTATWGDFDNDGDLDLLITGSPDNGSTFSSKLFRNDNGTFNEVNVDLPGVWGASVAWGDYDNDGDLDLLLTGYGTYGVTSRIYRNDGPSPDSTSWTFTDINAPLARVNSSSVAWGDYDNDGNLDILYSGYLIGGSGGFTTIYKGDGHGNFVDIHPGLLGVGNSHVNWVDYDNDGDLDVLISGQLPDGHLITKIYRNDGGVFTDIGANLQGVYYSATAWGDYDNDGKLDLLVTGFSEGVGIGGYLPMTKLYHNDLQRTNTVPAAPAGLSETMSGSTLTLQWGKSSDAQTPQSMLTYNIALGTTSTGGQLITPMSDGTTGYHRIARIGNRDHQTKWTTKGLPPGTYYWRVQAVDNVYAGSAFSPVRRLVIGSGSGQLTQEFAVNDMWNMISVPLKVDDYAKTVLYPSATSPAFAYAGSYTVKSTLANGRGYWLRFAGPQSVPLTGVPRFRDTVAVTAGWNMVGSIDTAILVSSISSNPPGIVTSLFFGYGAGYKSADVIEPGKAYWVKVHQSGQFILSSSPSSQEASNRIRIVPTSELPPAPPAAIPPDGLPEQYALEQNYPNPFNPGTTIRYQLPARSSVRLAIYNVLGQLVKTLVDQEIQEPGNRSVDWDAADNRGERVGSGVYLYRIDAISSDNSVKAYREVRKMLFMK